jgi:hypothetical protein
MSDPLFKALAFALQKFAAELKLEEAEAWKSPRNEVAYYTTKKIRERLEEIMRLYSAKKHHTESQGRNDPEICSGPP